MSLQQEQIAASELILDARGHIYHLGLAPGMIADTVLVVGDPGRVEQVSRYFDRIEHRTGHREFITHTGYVGGKRISVVSTGIGPDNIDIVLNELDALVNIDFTTRTVKTEKKQLSIIRLGTSGALQADIPADGLVVSSFGIGLDNLLHFYQHPYNPEEQYILAAFEEHIRLTAKTVHPYIAEGSIRLRNHFSSGYIHGITVTCPGFYGPQGRVLRGAVRFPHLVDALGSFSSRQHRVVNFEMETSAIYGLGKIFGHHCLSVNTVIANRVHKQFSKDPAAAVDHMIRTSLSVIESLV